MAKTNFFLDKRTPRADGSCHLKISISAKRKTAYVPTDIWIQQSQWDAVTSSIVNHPHKRLLNSSLAMQRGQVEEYIFLAEREPGGKNLTAIDLRNGYVWGTDPAKQSEVMSFYKRFKAFASTKSASTKSLYDHTLRMLLKFCPKLESLPWEAINADWLKRFDAFLAKGARGQGTSANYRAIHMRNIRSVFNAALDSEDTTLYPFRKFKIKSEKTRKRALALEQLRKLFDYPVEGYAEIYRDMFKLIFMLIGINTVDLHRLKEITPEGRVEYRRSKTGRLYSIRVEKEAMEIIERYRGKKGLLCIADRWSDHRNFRHQLNKALQNIGTTRTGLGGKRSAEGAFPGVTSYWARHTWATIACYLDIPKETIAAALGHSSNTVTDIYIDFDQRKVDQANRRVLDWVLYGIS